MWSCSVLLLTHLDLAGSCVDRLFTIAAGTGCPFRRCWCSGATASAATGDGAVVAAARAAGGGTVCVFYIGFNLQSEGHTLLAAVLLWGKFGWNAVDLDVDADLLQWVPEDLDSVQWAGAQRLRHVAEAVRKRYVHLNDAFAWAGLLPLLHLFALHELQAALVEADLDHALQEGMGGENRGFCEKWQEVKSFGKFIRTRRFHMYIGMVMPRISQVARLNWGLLKSIEPSIYTHAVTQTGWPSRSLDSQIIHRITWLSESIGGCEQRLWTHLQYLIPIEGQVSDLLQLYFVALALVEVRQSLLIVLGGDRSGRCQNVLKSGKAWVLLK